MKDRWERFEIYFPGLKARAGAILPFLGRRVLARERRKLPAKKWMICSLTGAVSSEIVSKVRKLLTGYRC